MASRYALQQVQSSKLLFKYVRSYRTAEVGLSLKALADSEIYIPSSIVTRASPVSQKLPSLQEGVSLVFRPRLRGD